MTSQTTLLIASSFFLAMPSCNPPKKTTPGAPSAGDIASDVPLLPIKKGDVWNYSVHLEIPADVTSPGASEVDEKFERVRTYIGKIVPVNGLPEVDCFEVAVPGSPVEREFVEIQDKVILMRGSMIMRPETTQPMWLDPPVPFVIAGRRSGDEFSDVQAPGGSLSRKTQVVGRETVKVPAGTFPSIRLLITGMDGELELRRTIWFAPGTGIVREEKSRYRRGKVIYREQQELSKTSVTPRVR